MDAVMDRFRELPRPLPLGETAANRLFATPGWREQMAQHLAEMVVKCRVTKADADAYLEAHISPDSSIERKADLPSFFEAVHRAGAATNPRVNLAFVLGSMKNLNDRRIVPLVAPLLAETTVGIGDYDSSFAPPQDRADEVLGELARRGVIEKPRETNRYGGFNVEIWRRWWAENRSKFDPVPAPLRPIDEGRTVAAPPAILVPVSTPIASPVPVASTDPMPVPPVATEAQDWRVPGAVVGGVVLLGLGVWAFARRTPKK